MLKQLLQAIIDRIKPCQHDWQQIERTNVLARPDDDQPTWMVWTYCCSKCCKFKRFKS